MQLLHLCLLKGVKVITPAQGCGAVGRVGRLVHEQLSQFLPDDAVVVGMRCVVFLSARPSNAIWDARAVMAD